MTKPFISIITITCQNLAGLQATIESVLGQTARDYEYIVIDGGSSDGTRELLARLSDRLAYWVSEPDGGIYEAMNKGIAQARGTYCLFMNAGDRFHRPDVLERCTPLMQGDKDFYIGHQQNVGAHPLLVRAPGKVNAVMLATKFLSHQAAFIRTSLLKVRPYDTSLRVHADWKQMFTELILNSATYQRLDLVVADFDTSGISHSGIPCNERDEELRRLFPPRLHQCICPDDAFTRKMLYALFKERPLERDLKLLRNVLKQLAKDLFAKARR